MGNRGTNQGAPTPDFIYGRHVFEPKRPVVAAQRFTGLLLNLSLLAVIGLIALDGAWNTATLVATGFLAAAWLLTLPDALGRLRHPPATKPVVLNESLVTEVRKLKRQGDQREAIRVIRERTGLSVRDAEKIVHRAV